MKIMFIVYHDLKIEARSQEILECAKKMGDTTLVSYSKPLDETNVNFFVTGNGKRSYALFIKDAIKLIKEKKPEVIILHDNFTAILLPIIKKINENTFVIYDSSELYIEKRKSRTLNGKLGVVLQYMEKKYINMADIIIAANIERAKIMKEYYNLKEIPIIFDNIHKIEDSYDESICQKKYDKFFYKNGFNIVYGGGISKPRLTYELAKEVGELGINYNLIITGNSNEDDKEELNKLIRSKGFSNISYLGFVPRNEWKYLLKRADLSVSIFAQDTVNNINCASGKLYESLFEGTPILTSENPPLKRVCEDHKVGISTNSFKKGILEIEADKNYYINNVNTFIGKIDVQSRIDILAEVLTQKLREI